MPPFPPSFCLLGSLADQPPTPVLIGGVGAVVLAQRPDGLIEVYRAGAIIVLEPAIPVALVTDPALQLAITQEALVGIDQLRRGMTTSPPQAAPLLWLPFGDDGEGRWFLRSRWLVFLGLAVEFFRGFGPYGFDDGELPDQSDGPDDGEPPPWPSTDR